MTQQEREQKDILTPRDNYERILINTIFKEIQEYREWQEEKEKLQRNIVLRNSKYKWIDDEDDKQPTAEERLRFHERSSPARYATGLRDMANSFDRLSDNQLPIELDIKTWDDPFSDNGIGYVKVYTTLTTEKNGEILNQDFYIERMYSDRYPKDRMVFNAVADTLLNIFATLHNGTVCDIDRQPIQLQLINWDKVTIRPR